MNRKLVTTIMLALLTLLLSVGGTMAQDSQPAGEVSITAEVNSRISYQGVLKENGNPVTGSRDMTFRLYSDDTCTTQVGSDIDEPGVQVANGLFSVALDVTHGDFNGQGLWLEVEVRGTAIVCQEILPVPYALSLRPGASVVGDVADGNAIFARNTATTGLSRGLYGDSASTDGQGVFGRATAVSGETYGVYGLSTSPSGRGVYGSASATSGTTCGVHGWSRSPDYSCGVYGEASATSGTTYGVYGKSDSPEGYGVFGIASAGSGTNYGVYGWTNSTSGYAGFFFGDVYVAGTLGKSGGSFKIDHPLDPENKYLSHSFVESPDMMNVYNGNVVLDENGQAWVELPDYFEALNRDFRYQLTCIGGFAPVYIAQEIEDNRFQIAGGEPGLKVSWQVTGIRQDPWANANRIPVAEEKPPDEQGYYLHPEVYGQPDSKGIHTIQDPEQHRK